MPRPRFAVLAQLRAGVVAVVVTTRAFAYFSAEAREEFMAILDEASHHRDIARLSAEGQGTVASFVGRRPLSRGSATGTAAGLCPRARREARLAGLEGGGRRASLTAVRIGLVILPSDRWKEARRQWEWADAAGFSTAWTYDHIRWGGMPDGPWHAAVPVLAAAAGVTQHIRLGTLVATPNFRHPVTLARDVLALDDLSDGRFDLGLGPGSEGPDATALGQAPWSVTERMERFAEFVQIIRPVLNGGAATRTTIAGRYYTAVKAPSTPGARQAPFPLTMAAGGRRGLDLAATFGQQWVTIGPTGAGPRTPESVLTAVRRQVALLEIACAAQGRDPATLRKVVLWTPVEPVLTSLDQFDELAAPYEALGFDQLVLHHPQQTGPYGGSPATFEEIAARHADQAG